MNKNLLSSLLKIILILIITMVVHISTINANLVPNKNLRPKRSTDSSSSTNNIHEPHHRHRHGRRPVTESRRTTTSDSEHLAGENATLIVIYYHVAPDGGWENFCLEILVTVIRLHKACQSVQQYLVKRKCPGLLIQRNASSRNLVIWLVFCYKNIKIGKAKVG